MTIPPLVTNLVSSLKKIVEAILIPQFNTTKPKQELVKVRLICLLPPELPGWKSSNPRKRW
jgi:hypothetical protein